MVRAKRQREGGEKQISRGVLCVCASCLVQLARDIVLPAIYNATAYYYKVPKAVDAASAVLLSLLC